MANALSFAVASPTKPEVTFRSSRY